MKSLEDHLLNKVGDFFNEPDTFKSCAFGYPTYAMRNNMKAWCGYVGVPPSHKLFGRDYSDRVVWARDTVHVQHQSPIILLCEALRDEDNTVSVGALVDVHGGITWARNHLPSYDADGWWWFGFDCAHFCDLTPFDAHRRYTYKENCEYRNLTYVRYHIHRLACQLAEIDEALSEVDA